MKIKEIVEKVRKELNNLEEIRKVAFEGVREIEEDSKLSETYKSELIKEITEKYIEKANKIEIELNEMIEEEREKNINAFMVLDIEIIKEIQAIKDYINGLNYTLDLKELKHLLSKYDINDKKGLYILIQLNNFLYEKESYKEIIKDLFDGITERVNDYNKYDKLKPISIQKGVRTSPYTLNLSLYLDSLEKI